MNQFHQKRVGCLLIDDPAAGANRLRALSLPAEIEALPFEWRLRGAWEALQARFYEARRSSGSASVIARGYGCTAALALAEQLPVERLLLLWPSLVLSRGHNTDAAAAKSLRRLGRFAGRNLPLCVADALLVEGASDRGARALKAGGLGLHGRLARLCLADESAAGFPENAGDQVKTALTTFLLCGELPKELAQNREMCIIYG